MTDRFNDGDLSNNDHGFNLYKPEDTRFYSGGDLQGVIDKIDYIKQLGATALWITPPNANMWYSARNGVTGYHGYWSRNFETVDEKFGDLETYKELSHLLHSNDMYLIQDIVANHVGSYFHYKDNNFDPKDTSKNFELIKGNIPDALHEQPLFTKVNRQLESDAKANIYHWTPEISDHFDIEQEYTYQTAGLNDLNTSNVVVRKQLKESFGYWIKEVGVDAYRLDTAKYLDPPFIENFLHDTDGLLATAESTGRNHFPVFGELFETSLPYSDTAEQGFLKYQGTDETPGINGLIGFPLYKSIEEVFRSGRPTKQISYRIQKQMELYKDPYTVFNFIDNHDVKDKFRIIFI
jgi:glycosidase